MVSFLFVLVMFGFTFSLINDKSYLAVILSGISIAFGFVITGTTDYLRLLYDKLYLGIKIMLIILKYFTFAIINSFVFKVFDSNIILFLVVFVSDFISSIVTRRLLKLWEE